MRDFDIYITNDPDLVEYLNDKGLAHIPAYNVETLREIFMNNGFNVTAEAIEHNREAWSFGEKSGYRDEVNGYHLFSPCGCNPFSVTASELDPSATWQITYTA